MAGSGNGDVNRYVLVAWLLVCALLAFVLRALPYGNFLGKGGEYLFYGPDSYDHLRRITMGMADFPRIPSFDSYYGYPAGTGQIWSPLFDYVISILAIAAGGTTDVGVAHLIGFWLSPVLSALSAVLVYAAGARLFGRQAGMAASFVFALLPGHILYSFVSELDHHVAEPMVALALFLSLMRWAEPSDEGSPKIPGWFRTGCWMVFAILMWRGAVLFWGIALTSLALQILAVGLKGENPAGLSRYSWRSSLSAAALLTPLCFFNVWGTSGGMSFGIVSWFHVLLLAAFALIFFLLGKAFPFKRGFWVVVGSVPLVVAALGAFIPGGKTFVRELLSGLAVIGGSDPWLDSIAELRPMLFPAGKWDLWHVTETVSFLYWLFPLILVPVFARWRRSSYRDFRSCLFLVCGVVFWMIPLFRERYVHLAAVTTALGGGFLFSWLVERFTGAAKKRGAFLIAGGVVLLLLAPVSTFLWGIPRLGLPDHEKYDLMAALAWLRERTPPTSFFDRPVRRPEYGVLADWGLGAYIDYVAQRPAVATNFGWETHGLFESAAFLTLADPAAAEKIAQDNRVRYILLNQVTGHLPRLRTIAEYGMVKGRSPLPFLPPFKPLETMYYRLYIQNGSAFAVQGVQTGALGNYRLVYASPNGFTDPVAGPVSHYKIFERVSGALIKGRGVAGSGVEIQLHLKSTSGSMLTFRDSTAADNAGAFSFRVPYATDHSSGDFMPLGSYRVKAGDRMFAVPVGERDVTAGAVVLAR